MRFAAIVILGLALPGSLPAAASAAATPTRLTVSDMRTRSEWIESRAWGGGARFLFLSDDNIERRMPRGYSLGGGGPEFTFGCSRPDPSRSHWRFRVDFSPAGNGITGADERARSRADAYYFGAPGVVILIDEMDDEMGRFPLRPGADGAGLETGPLPPADVERFMNASGIRAETPRIRFESGTIGLQRVFLALAQTPCGVRR
jgi:hypothetical protein